MFDGYDLIYWNCHTFATILLEMICLRYCLPSLRVPLNFWVHKQLSSHVNVQTILTPSSVAAILDTGATANTYHEIASRIVFDPITAIRARLKGIIRRVVTGGIHLMPPLQVLRRLNFLSCVMPGKY